MFGPYEDVCRVSDLDQRTFVHDRGSLAELPDYRQIVRDHDQREAAVVPEIEEEIDDLGLNRCIERRNRLVQHDELRARREGARDGDALSFTTGERVWEGGFSPCRKADPIEDLTYPCAAIPGAAYAVGGQWFGDDGSDPEARIKRGPGVLKYRLEVAPEGPNPAFREIADDLTTEAHDAAVWTFDREQQPRQRALAGP